MTATVRAINVYPVRGEPAVELSSVVVGADGLDGDRRKGAPVHLVSLDAIGAAETPRANLLIDFGAGAPDGFERAWLGRELAIGDVVLRVTSAPRHCLGIYAEVVRGGSIATGATVVPDPPAGDTQTHSESAGRPG
jgi:hypothetical protein